MTGKTRRVAILLGTSALALVGVRAADDALAIQHAECPFFGASHDQIVQASLRGFRDGQLARIAGRIPTHEQALSALTESVANSLAAPPPGTRTGAAADPASSNTIDRYLFPAMAKANVAPAPPTTDWEFIRRVTLDLTGRIPTPDQVTVFIANTSPTKRADYVDTLLGSSQWLDKWT